MCGIAGVAFFDCRRQADPAQIAAMRDTMSHRGPDDCGVFISPGIALASRRLAILDLSERGRMPMSTDDGRFHAVYNGEIYNYRELREQLELRGLRFRSNTDTEVLLRLYATHGPEMLPMLNGMFAIAIWDARERTLFLARDRLGVKPLFWFRSGDRLLFASEESALFAAGVPAEVRDDSWPELLCFRYVAGADTVFRGLHRLLPGHYMICRDGDVWIRRWWSLADQTRAQREKPAPTDWFSRALQDSVRLRRISDVPVGVLLSGGLDSGTVASVAARQAESRISSFTVRFADRNYDEGAAAAAVARRWNLDHHELHIDPEEVFPALSEAAAISGQPPCHASDLHLLAISRHARPLVTVLLSGEGGDELLGGYVRYQPLRFPGLVGIAKTAAKMPSLLPLGRRWRKLLRLARAGSVARAVLFNSCELLPDDLHALGMDAVPAFPFREQILEEACSLYPGEPFRQAMYLDQHTFLCSILDRNDRMTMRASIECRVPFLDYRIVEGAAALPTRALGNFWHTKAPLRRDFGHLLPPEVLRGRKWGFGVPWRSYLREVRRLRDTVRYLADSEAVRQSPLSRPAVARCADAFLAGDDSHEPLVRQLTFLSVWWDSLRARPTDVRQQRSCVTK
jgi:asparagine synthase (glutamine-hydrolysing)